MTFVPLHILLVDDDPDDQDIYKMAVDELELGIKCYFANDGIHALEILQNGELFPDCIFLDMNMPRMNGVQCLEELSKDTELNKIPTFMYSTAADPQAIEKAKMLGAIDFIVKPPSITELTGILENIFQKIKIIRQSK